MKNIVDGVSMLLREVTVVICLIAGAVILVIASLFEKMHGLGR
jgi:hypothetical protein